MSVVDAIADSLEIKNVRTRHTRAEDIKDSKFDVVVSRAVAPLKNLWQWSKPLLRKSDRYQGLICLKGGDLTREIFESGCKPAVWEIEKIFTASFFKEKYILQVK